MLPYSNHSSELAKDKCPSTSLPSSWSDAHFTSRSTFQRPIKWNTENGDAFDEETAASKFRHRPVNQTWLPRNRNYLVNYFHAFVY
jgi:hypothetical protein